MACGPALVEGSGMVCMHSWMWCVAVALVVGGEVVHLATGVQPLLVCEAGEGLMLGGRGSTGPVRSACWPGADAWGSLTAGGCLFPAGFCVAADAAAHVPPHAAAPCLVPAPTLPHPAGSCSSGCVPGPLVQRLAPPSPDGVPLWQGRTLGSYWWAGVLPGHICWWVSVVCAS
jgi:hypothetical protein